MDYKLYDTLNEIKALGKSDAQVRKEIYDLWRECFGDTKDYTDFYFEWKVKDNRIITLYKSERLSSMLHLNPYSVRTGGKTEQLNYIVGVATRPEDRRQGLMKLLLETSLNQMFEEHMPFTYLMPAAEAIYLPFGFRIVYEQIPWKQQLILAGRNNGDNSCYKPGTGTRKLIKVKSSDEDTIGKLTSFTCRYLSEHYDIYTERTPYYYKRLIYEMESGKGGVLLGMLEDKAVGYISYMTDGGLGIAECICEAEEKESFMAAAAKEILGGSGAYYDKEEPGTPAIMARIVDFKAFMKTITAQEEVTLTVKAEDSIIRENSGVYRLKFSNTGCLAEKMDGEPELAGDISELTRLFFGKLSREEITALIRKNDVLEILNKVNRINLYNKVFINDVV